MFYKENNRKKMLKFKQWIRYFDIKKLKDKKDSLHQLINENKVILNKEINENKEISKNYPNLKE